MNPLQNHNRYNDKVEKHPEMRAFCMLTYLISGAGAIMQCFTPTVLIGLFLLFITYFMLRAQKITARGTIYQSHVEWARSTIMIGMFLLFPIAIIAAIYFVWEHTGLAEAIKTASQKEDIGDIIGFVHSYISDNQQKIYKITSWAMVPPLLWWLRRCIVGFCHAKESEPIDFPGSLI